MKKISKILLVDDDMDIIIPNKIILENQGYEVIIANDKVEGLAMAKSEKPDLAILDVMMNTQYEGFELAKDIKNDPETSGIMVAIHTSIEVFTTTKPEIQLMSHEIRKDPNNRSLKVVLIKNIVNGKAGIDYYDNNSMNVFIKIDEFIAKPMTINNIAAAIVNMEANND